MDAFIEQDDKPLAFWNYTKEGEEFLFIFVILTELHTILLDAQLIIYTDHLNITTDNIVWLHNMLVQSVETFMSQADLQCRVFSKTIFQTCLGSNTLP